ncbi:hypothetical protein BC937DRAFT_87479 [Endogone sp. FLAS-F59071]|nr:hypothetical protein BC937DRAFT_87479 [Endogone sp. FLAS-F59071]|eukprot:RUS22735.1 hypothetical protein BC937DRAFT_87479 [Endogone sp. FLAS-F59071]
MLHKLPESAEPNFKGSLRRWRNTDSSRPGIMAGADIDVPEFLRGGLRSEGILSKDIMDPISLCRLRRETSKLPTSWSESNERRDEDILSLGIGEVALPLEPTSLDFG